MAQNINFNSEILSSIVGGSSAIDLSRLNIQSLEQAHEFSLAYGFNLNDEQDLNVLWGYYRRAVTFLNTQILEDNERVPEGLSDPRQLNNLAYLLIYASTKDNKKDSLQTWACALLRVMHVLVHLDNDLFNFFSSDIQDQVLKPIQDKVRMDPFAGPILGAGSEFDQIQLKKFDIKPFKADDSSIIKLLIKPEAVAFRLLDKIGVRFVTKTIFDTYRVMRYLVRSHIVSLPHFIPDQSNNTIYPTNLFIEVMESLPNNSELKPEVIDKKLLERLNEAQERAEYREKINHFSSDEFKFIKFISRKLIRVQVPGDQKQSMSFFYPYEIQIMDYNNYLQSISGPSDHEKYKDRQKRRARARVLGLKS